MEIYQRGTLTKSKLSICAIIAMLATACGSQPTPTVEYKPTVTPHVFTSNKNDVWLAPCDGFEVLESYRVYWPRNERLLEQLESSEWRYYRCPQSRISLAAQYRTKSVQPPYNWQEVIWVEESYGTVGVYFDPNVQLWTYVWFLENQSQGGESFLAVVRAAPGFSGGCQKLDRFRLRRIAERDPMDRQPDSAGMRGLKITGKVECKFVMIRCPVHRPGGDS